MSPIIHSSCSPPPPPPFAPLICSLCKWQSRPKFKQIPDPRLEHAQKYLASMRKSAKSDRLLVHINGHGVPHPTANGESWCFNRDYTQYVPLPMQSLKQWAGAPATFVLDCSRAGLLVPFFEDVPSVSAPAPRYDGALFGMGGAVGSPASSMVRNAPIPGPVPLSDEPGTAPTPIPFIVFAACGPNESLPVHPEMPADVFTACLTMPLKVALRWAVLRRCDVLPPAFRAFTDFLPGHKADRSTPLGELHWILTAVTDAIAWAVMPRPAFVTLFRSDYVNSNLWRNFLLADRIMRTLGCVPVSLPALPRTHDHPLWASWDSAVEGVLSQLPALFGYNFSDVMRISALHLTPDLSKLRNTDWGDMVPVPVQTDAVTPAAQPAAPVPVQPPPGSGGAPVSSVNGPRSGRTSLARSHVTAGAWNKLAGSAASTLIPFDMSAFAVDALALPIPPSASATAGERVSMLRRRLERVARTTSMGAAPNFAALGLASYTPSTYFDEQVRVRVQRIKERSVQFNALSILSASRTDVLIRSVVVGCARETTVAYACAPSRRCH
jgi:hypothetical protein